MDEIKRLTPAQRARCNRLIRRLCANYDGGNCLPLDDGEGCVCVQTISYSLLCKYFRRAVLPADKVLCADTNTWSTRWLPYVGGAVIWTLPTMPPFS